MLSACFSPFRVCTAVFALAFTLCAQAGEIVVAQVAPFTGPVAVYSREINLGASALFDAVNQRGGINGAKIRFIKRDDQLDPRQTVALFEQLAREERPVAFLFPVGPLGIAALQGHGMPRKLGVPVVGTVPSLYKLRLPVNPFVFHLGVGDDAELMKIIEHVETSGVSKIGVVYWNEPSALDAVSVIEREARARGITVAMKAPVEAGTDKVGDAVTETFRQKPGALITILPVNATGALVKALRQAENGTPVYGLSYTESFLLSQMAGPRNAQGVGVSQVVPNPFSQRRSLVREYQRDVRKHAPIGTRLSTLSLQGYIAAKVVTEGLRRSGPSPTPMALRNALESLRNVDLGDLTINYSAQQHVGLDFLDIGVVSGDGQLRY